jgi:hypothetical protein
LCNVNRDDLLSPSVELVVPLRKQWTRACCELRARVQPFPESLVEFMERHRDEVTKCLSLELDQSSLGYLMFDMQTMKTSMLGQTSITQESPNQDLLLPAC